MPAQPTTASQPREMLVMPHTLATQRMVLRILEALISTPQTTLQVVQAAGYRKVNPSQKSWIRQLARSGFVSVLSADRYVLTLEGEAFRERYRVEVARNTARASATERQVEVTIQEYYEWGGWVVTKVDAGQVVRGRAYGTIPIGEPDLIVEKGVHAFRVETKTESGQLSPQQQLRHAYLRAAGIPVYVVRNIEDAKASLEDFKRRIKQRS